MDTALVALNNLLGIINDILDFSKIEAGRIEIVEARVDVAGLCRSVIDIFREQILKKELDCVLEPAPGLPTRACRCGPPAAGPVQPRRQLLKFTDTGAIRLGDGLAREDSTDSRGKLLFTVSDTGIGIPADKLTALFQPFTQVDGALSRRYQGTGLGLSIVKRLVGLMGGDVGIESSLAREPPSGSPSMSASSRDEPPVAAEAPDARTPSPQGAAMGHSPKDTPGRG